MKTGLETVSGKIPTWKTLQPSTETFGHGNKNERSEVLDCGMWFWLYQAQVAPQSFFHFQFQHVCSHILVSGVLDFDPSVWLQMQSLQPVAFF